ncbi:MAG: hypothetical protein LUO91_08120, partial [Methanomicrobiales archaeon]|nr:hypothetical protein [Methanomicrobiales archaeon]
SPVDIDVTYLEETPRYAFDAAKNNPAPGDQVTFVAHLRNRGTDPTGTFTFRWYLDGTQVATGTAQSIPAGGSTTVSHTWTWQDGSHDISFFADPGNAVQERSEQNNLRTDRTNALRVGFWVEQSVYDYFDQNQYAFTRQYGIADEANSWEDWAQRHMALANRLLGEAAYPSTPDGALDRWRLDRVIVVPDNALPLNGGLPTNHPDTRDRTVDMMWGFERDILPNNFYRTTDNNANPFNQELSLLHEMLHARFLVDAYGLNIHGHSMGVLDDQGARMYPGGGEMTRVNSEAPSMMNSDPWFSEWEAAALNLWAGRRPQPGWANYNAHAGLGWYIANHMPAQNYLRVKDSRGLPVAGATVQVYKADQVPSGSSDPNIIEAAGDFYKKYIDTTVDLQGTTDANGLFSLGANPFSVPEPIGGWDFPRCVDFVKIRVNGRVYPAWLDLPQVQVQWHRGNRQVAYFDVQLPVEVIPTTTPTATPTPQPNPTPVLSGISPATATAGGSAFTMTVTGTGFIPASKVRWNGADRATTYVSSTTLSASIPSSDLATAGTRTVTVFTAAPGGGTSDARTFTISQAPTPTPTPSPTPTSTQTPVSQVTIGGKVIDEYNMAVPYTYVAVAREDTGARTYVYTSYDGSFRANVPYSTTVRYALLTWDYSAGEVMRAGIVPDRDRLDLDLRFGTQTPTPTRTATLTPTPTPQPNPVPVLSGISPTSATAGGSGFTLTVTGTSFLATSKVRWNGADRTTTYVSATRLTVSIPASDIASAGIGSVTVFTAAPGGGTSGARTFTISQAPTPTPTVSPTATPTPATTVTLGGTVRDSDGRPMPYTYVYVIREGQGSGTYRYTAADGSYRTSVPRSSTARYTIQAWDYLYGAMEIRGVVPDQDRLNLDLAPGVAHPTPTPPPTPTPTATPTATPSPTPTLTVTPTQGPDPVFQTITAETSTGTAPLGNYDSRGSYYGPRMQTQSLKAVGSSISRIAVPLVKTGNPAQEITVTVENAWLQPVGWTTIPASVIRSTEPSRLEWVTAEFTKPVQVSKGSLYYVKLSVTSRDEKNFFLIPLHGGNPYQPGNWWRGDAEYPDMTTDLLVKVAFSA